MLQPQPRKGGEVPKAQPIPFWPIVSPVSGVGPGPVRKPETPHPIPFRAPARGYRQFAPRLGREALDRVPVQRSDAGAIDHRTNSISGFAYTFKISPSIVPARMIPVSSSLSASVVAYAETSPNTVTPATI